MTQTATSLPIPDLSEADEHAWRLFRSADPALSSPYFSLDYLKILTSVQPGASVIRIEIDGELAGFLPYRKDFLGTGRAPDGLLGDLHGVVCAPQTTINVSAALRDCGLGGYSFSGAPMQQARHGLTGVAGDGNQIIGLDGGYEAWLAERYEASSSFRRTHRKIEKLLTSGIVEISHQGFDEARFQRLIELKQDGYAGAGHFDVFSLNWPARLLRALATASSGDVRGVFSTMLIEGEFAAACFCMRSESVLHYWFPGYEKQFSDLKPGHAMLFSLAHWAGEQGLREFHLGPGNVQYKREMASYAAPVRFGNVAVGLSQRLLNSFHAWSAEQESRGGRFSSFPAKLARKLDRVTLTGRLRA